MTMTYPELTSTDSDFEEIDSLTRLNRLAEEIEVMGQTVTGGGNIGRTVMPGISELVIKQNPLPPSFDELRKIQKEITKGEKGKSEKTIEEVAQKYLLGKTDRPKKIKISQKIKRKAKTLENYKTYLGRAASSIMFYRYTRVPVQKKYNPQWKGNKKESCILISKTGVHSCQFSFAICKEKDKFVKDEARYLCQNRMTNSLIVSVTNMNRENSYLENIRAGIDNYFLSLNKDAGNPILSFPATAANAVRQLKQLGKLIKLELEDEKNLWQEKT